MLSLLFFLLPFIKRVVFFLTSPFQKNPMERMESRIPGSPSWLHKTKLPSFGLQRKHLANTTLLNSVWLCLLFPYGFVPRRASLAVPLHPNFHNYYCPQEIQYLYFVVMPSSSGTVFWWSFLRSVTTWPLFHFFFFF